jgi:hypothetical protein
MTDKAIPPHPTDPPSSLSLASYFIILVLVLTQVLSLFLWLMEGEKGLREKTDMEQNGHAAINGCGHKSKYCLIILQKNTEHDYCFPEQEAA